ncbi:MAG: phytase [Ignavibacteria bacterium]|jgi:3-phytase
MLKYNYKLSLLIFLLIIVSNIVYTQTTVVTPTLTLNASGIADQDDMCVWISSDSSQSTIITSDKTANKIFVYDLNGNTLQTIDVPGKPGNIDIRYNFLLSGHPTDIVGYNDRSNGTIVLYKVDPATRQLLYVSEFSDSGMTGNNYGFCLYRSMTTGKYYAIASSNSTQMKQWELVDNGDGTIGGVLKRTWNNGSGDITEGLVADDETGELYCANEGEGIYKYDADPIVSNPVRTLVAAVGDSGLTADVEGITIYYAANGEGYLIASSQGSDTYMIYERKEPHNFVKTIEVVGASNTDGIDVTNVNLGTGFPGGMFIIHDGSGSSPFTVQVCKYEDLGLPVDTEYWNPREFNTSPVESNFQIPSNFVLDQNYPNPFNPSTKIRYQLPTPEFVNITVYNVIGNAISVLVDEYKNAGNYELIFDAGDLPSGIYLYVLKAGNYAELKKMVLLK